jgi:hypothetical protein
VTELVQTLREGGRALPSALRVARQLCLERLACLDVEQALPLATVTSGMTALAEATGWFDAVWSDGRPDWSDLPAVARLIGRLRGFSVAEAVAEKIAAMGYEVDMDLIIDVERIVNSNATIEQLAVAFLLTEDQKASAAERSAIMEYDGGLTRREANIAAINIELEKGKA